MLHHRRNRKCLKYVCGRVSLRSWKLVTSCEKPWKVETQPTSTISGGSLVPFALCCTDLHFLQCAKMMWMYTCTFSPFGQDTPCSEIYCEGSAVNGNFSMASASCCHHMPAPFHLSESMCFTMCFFCLIWHPCILVQHTVAVQLWPRSRAKDTRKGWVVAIRLHHNVGWNWCEQGDHSVGPRVLCAGWSWRTWFVWDSLRCCGGFSGPFWRSGRHVELPFRCFAGTTELLSRMLRFKMCSKESGWKDKRCHWGLNISKECKFHFNAEPLASDNARLRKDWRPFCWSSTRSESLVANGFGFSGVKGCEQRNTAVRKVQPFVACHGKHWKNRIRRMSTRKLLRLWWLWR